MSNDFRSAGPRPSRLGGQLQSCNTARARPKCLTEEKCFKSTALEQSYRVAAQSISVQRVPDGRRGATERAVGEVSSGSRSVE